MLKNIVKKLLSGKAVAHESQMQPTPPNPAQLPLAENLPLADTFIQRGNECEDAGQLVQARDLYLQAVEAAPGHARSHLNLGIALASMGDRDGAQAAYERVLATDPTHPFGNYNYARLAFLAKEYAKADSLLRAALRSKPDFPQALVIHADVLEALGRLDEAVGALQAALEFEPENSGSWLNLGQLLMKMRRIDDAEGAIRQALRFGGPNSATLGLLSRIQNEHGFGVEALATLREAIAVENGWQEHRSNELMLLNIVEDIPVDDIFRRHVDYGRRMEAENPIRFEPRLRNRAAHRRLRIGYLSGDFCIHPVTNFILPVLEHHDSATVEVYCYSSTQKEDHVTGWVRERAHHWIDARGLSDDALADRIHADEIDVLVDMSGHTRDNRLHTLCQRPAPVQVSWLGYINTTGLARIDYRLTDERADPLTIAQPLHTERLMHMPDSQWCYRPFIPMPVGDQAPVERNGYITFGSSNSALKITPGTTRRWGRLMAAVPKSRLRVADIKSTSKREAILADLASEGIAADRVEFVPRVNLDKYLALYHEIDISLDTYPYGGGTTTLDSLWMGVPVVAAVGPTSVSRSAASILQLLGLHDWVASSADDVVDVARRQANDHANLAHLRRTLRERMQASPLMDEVRFTRSLEAAYRQMVTEAAREFGAADPAQSG